MATGPLVPEAHKPVSTDRASEVGRLENSLRTWEREVSLAIRRLFELVRSQPAAASSATTAARQPARRIAPIVTQASVGTTILSGTGAPVPSLGKNGDFYLDTSNGDFYGPKTGGAW